MITKKELTKIIRKNAREQIRIWQIEVKEWTNDDEMEFKFKGAIQGIKEFLINLQKIGVIQQF